MSKSPCVGAAAYAAVPSICRIPTHLFEFLALSEATATSSGKCKGKEGGSTGWGRAHRRAIGRWYNDYRSADASALAEAVTKVRGDAELAQRCVADGLVPTLFALEGLGSEPLFGWLKHMQTSKMLRLFGIAPA